MDTDGTTSDELTGVIPGVSSTGLKVRLGDKFPFNKSCENSASANLASSSANSAFSFALEMSLSASSFANSNCRFNSNCF